ncbi:alpha/beta fold hydrolase [Rhizobium setariae]|uniref:alpha/beta fold hydrolase n=1 Tax=Rhizobium setariae TaxID=2801340 RepID=UPI001FEFBF43|nr:alpha/beta hydrolase [Rhizobium setariae]
MHFDTTIRLETPNGAALATRHVSANTATPKAIVLICHGLAEHAGRYRSFADFLASRGYHVFAHDHRGHGETNAPQAPLGRFAQADGARLVIEDVIAVKRHAESLYPGLPVILFGHSMGAMIAAATAEAYPQQFAALAIWNASLNPGIAGKVGAFLLKAERFFKGSDVPSAFGPRFTFELWAKSVDGASSDFDWLSRDSAEVAAYVADPLCGFAPSVSMWLDVLALADAAGRMENLRRLPPDLPVHIVGGGHDPATDNGKAMIWLRDRMQTLGMTAVSLTIFDEMRHETLNEIGREDAMKAFTAWLDGVVAMSGKTEPHR